MMCIYIFYRSTVYITQHTYFSTDVIALPFQTFKLCFYFWLFVIPCLTHFSLFYLCLRETQAPPQLALRWVLSYHQTLVRVCFWSLLGVCGIRGSRGSFLCCQALVFLLALSLKFHISLFTSYDLSYCWTCFQTLVHGPQCDGFSS